MTTAQEFELLIANADQRISALTKNAEAMLRDVVVLGCHMAIGRDVGTQRARKLRRRGEDVRFAGRTATGKTRYRWARRIDPMFIYQGTP